MTGAIELGHDTAAQTWITGVGTVLDLNNG
jgi:hypothetical protein